MVGGQPAIPEVQAILGPMPIATELKPMIPMVEMGKGPINQPVINTPEADVYADEHGNSQVDMNKNPNRLKCSLGDIPDRGPESWKRVQEFMKLVKEGKAVYVPGNHEAMLMAAMTDDPSGKNRDKIQVIGWLINGGDATAAQAGADVSQFNGLVSKELTNDGIDPKTATADQLLKAKMQVGGRLNHIIGKGPPKPGSPNFNIANRVYNDAMQQVGGIQAELKKCPALVEYVNDLAQYAEPYAVINGALLVHGNISSVEDIQFLERVRVGLRSSDPVVRAQAIHDMNDGYTDAAGAQHESPLWNRDFTNIADPAKASGLRRQINEHFAQGNTNRPACKVEVILIGHTPVDSLKQGYGVANNALKTRSANRSGDPKILLMDYHAYDAQGVQAKMVVTLDAAGKANLLLVNDLDDQPLPDLQGKRVAASYEIQGTTIAVAEEPAQPVDAALAQSTLAELKAANIPEIPLAQLRVIDTDLLLQPGGLLEKAGWKDTPENRRKIDNLRAHANNEANNVIKNLKVGLNIKPEDLIAMTPEQMQARAEEIRQLLNAGSAEQAIEMATAAKDLMIEQKAGQQQQAEAAAAAQTATAATLSAAESALIGKMSPEAALLIITNDSFRGVMLDQLNNIIRGLRQEVAEKRMSEAEYREIIEKQLTPMIDRVNNANANRQLELDKLVKEGKLTEAQRNAIEQDIKIAVIQFEIASNPEIQPDVLAKKNEELKAAQDARAKIKEKDGSDPINMVVNVASMLCGAQPGTPEAQAVQNNPIGAVTDLMGKIIESGNPQGEFQALVGRIGQGLNLNEAQTQGLKTSMDEIFKQMMLMHEMINGKEKTTGEAIGGFLKMGGAISLIAILITFIKSLTGSGLISSGGQGH